MADEEKDMPCDSVVDAELEEAIQNRENLELALSNQNNVWGYSTVGLEAKKAAMSMLSTKHGMYARIPISCKADGCPYKDSCQLLPYNLAPFGELCPIETAQIETRFVEYAVEFDLDQSSFTDRNLVSEIINWDIMIERCKALMAKEGDPVINVVAGVSESGEEFFRPEVSKYWEAYERAQKRRNDIYQLMMATRRDKKGQGDDTQSIHEYLAEAMKAADKFVIEERPAEFKEE